MSGLLLGCMAVSIWLVTSSEPGSFFFVWGIVMAVINGWMFVREVTE